MSDSDKNNFTVYEGGRRPNPRLSSTSNQSSDDSGVSSPEVLSAIESIKDGINGIEYMINNQSLPEAVQPFLITSSPKNAVNDNEKYVVENEAENREILMLSYDDIYNDNDGNWHLKLKDPVDIGLLYARFEDGSYIFASIDEDTNRIISGEVRNKDRVLIYKWKNGKLTYSSLNDLGKFRIV